MKVVFTGSIQEVRQEMLAYLDLKKLAIDPPTRPQVPVGDPPEFTTDENGEEWEDVVKPEPEMVAKTETVKEKPKKGRRKGGGIYEQAMARNSVPSDPPSLANAPVAAPAADLPTPTEEPKAPEPQVIKPITSEDAMKALQEVNAARGIHIARDLLERFKCTRFSELKEKDFAEFVEVAKSKIPAPEVAKT